MSQQSTAISTEQSARQPRRFPPSPGAGAARFGLAALVLGAFCISFAPIFVKLSELEPTATAFQRMLLATPLLFLVAGGLDRRDGRGAFPAQPAAHAPSTHPRLMLLVAGLFFAGDLAFWHWSLAFTSVANSTLLANLAPVFVTLAAWLLLGELITPRFVAGLVVAFAGATVVVGTSLELEGHVLGDLLGVVTAMFYAGYLLSVKRLRRLMGPATLLARTSVVTAAALLPLTLLAGEQLVPETIAGWLVLLGLAWIPQVAGQGLIATGLAYLPASFSAVTLLLQPVSAAVLAWLILGESLGTLQALGGLLVLAGIALARSGSRI